MSLFVRGGARGPGVSVAGKPRRSSSVPGRDAVLRDRYELWREWHEEGRPDPETGRRTPITQAYLAALWGVDVSTICKGIAVASSIRSALHDALRRQREAGVA